MRIFLIILKASFNDKISLIWSIIFPVAILLIGKIFIQNELSSWYFLIGVLAISALSYGLMGTAFDYFTHRSTGVFKAVALSKTGIIKFLTYYTLTRLLVTMSGLLLILLIGIFVLGLDVNKIYSLGLFLYFFVLALSANLMGIISANFGKDAGGIATITNIIMIVLLGSSGLFYSLELLPNWLGVAFQFSPLEVMADLARAINLNIFALIYALVFCGILALIAFTSFRWE